MLIGINLKCDAHYFSNLITYFIDNYRSLKKQAIISVDYQPDVTLNYQHLVNKHGTKTRLILNTYHRLKVFKLRIEIQDERDMRSSN